MTLARKIKCRSCRKSFAPSASWIKWCSDECRDVVVKKLADEQRMKREKKSKEVLSKMKEKQKDRSYYIAKLQEHFNRFIRLRDAKEPCISCGTTNNVSWSAGHYFTVGSYPNLRFNEDNVNKQCWFNCNKNKSGNIAEYTPNLIKKIGLERFEALVSIKNDPMKLTIPELKEKIEHYKAECKRLTDSR